jgi:hypothetical protein
VGKGYVGKAAALAFSLLAVATSLAACGSTPLKGVAVRLPKATTSTTIDSVGVPPPSRKTTLPTETSTSSAIVPTATMATTATVPDCVASDLTMTARPQLSSYGWKETMNVIVEVLIQAGPSCRLQRGMFNPGDPSAGCYPDVFMHWYDAQLSPSNALLGPYLQSCPNTPSIVAPGAPVTVQIAAPFQCAGSDCAVSHDGKETWDVRVEWQLASGQNLGTGFSVVAVTPSEPPTITTTTSTVSTSTPTSTSTSTTSPTS